MAPSADTFLLHDNKDLLTTKVLPSKSALTTQVQELKENDIQPEPNTLVLNPAFITHDFDALRFSAAAAAQLPSLNKEPLSPPAHTDISPAYSTLLISSPYNSPGHYLDLSTLPPASRLFALALTTLVPTRPDYATAPYTSALNFSHVIQVLRQLSHASGHNWSTTSFYIVTFHSVLRPSIDQDHLYKLDFESHREACESGGLLKYWFGKADLDGQKRNLATCFWESKEHARRGGEGEWHRRARGEGRALYERIVFETMRFTVLDGVEGWVCEEWRE